MLQTGLTPARGFFFFLNITDCMELKYNQFLKQMRFLDQDFFPYHESDFSFQFFFSAFCTAYQFPVVTPASRHVIKVN